MAYEEADFRKSQQRRTQERVSERRVELRAMALAVAPVEHMTGEPTWDYFLKAIEAMIVPARKELDQVRSILTNPIKVDLTENILCKVRAANLEGMISALESVEALPKTIIAQGKLAIEALRQIEET